MKNAHHKTSAKVMVLILTLVNPITEAAPVTRKFGSEPLDVVLDFAQNTWKCTGLAPDETLTSSELATMMLVVGVRLR
jgi:hypothetical protein